MADKNPAAEENHAPPPEHAGNGHRSHGPSSHGHGEEHEGAPEWLISFADNVLLQLGFMVILLALTLKGASAGGMSHEGEKTSGKGAPTAQDLDFAIAVRAAFNNPVDINSRDVRDLLLVQRLRERLRGMSEAADEGLEGNEHDVQSIRQAGAYGVGGHILFDTRTSEPGENARRAAEALAEQFRGCQTVLDIRGHCSAEEAYGRDDRGMQLSYERARAVAELLASHGLSWSRLRVTACADSERVTPTTYEEAGHRSNQRVEVIQIDRAAETD